MYVCTYVYMYMYVYICILLLLLFIACPITTVILHAYLLCLFTMLLIQGVSRHGTHFYSYVCMYVFFIIIIYSMPHYYSNITCLLTMLIYYATYITALN